MRILIVDDDYQSRLLLQRLLERFGECHVEDDGKKAIGAFVNALASGDPFQLVCMDIMMPEMDGQQALQLIRQVEQKWDVQPGCEAKVLMVSAVDDIKEVSKAFFRGCATDYVVKPLQVDTLIAKVNDLLGDTCSGEGL